MSVNLNSIPVPRLVRPAPDPLGLYLRLGRGDHTVISNLLASGDATCFGAVFDPLQLKRHSELQDQMLQHRLDVILDPKTQQLALPGSFTKSLGEMPWGNPNRPHLLKDFQGRAGQHLIAVLGDYVTENGFTQVIAPTHILESADDPWAEVDADMTHRLRDHLNRGQGSSVQLIYSLAIPSAVLRNKDQRRALINRLKNVPVSALWLKVDRFGSDSSATAALAYIDGVAEFHELGIPIVADHVGGVIGLSLMAFGAVGGIAHGITLGERFNAASWRKPPVSGGFAPHHRVYIPEIDLLLKRNDAEALLGASHRARGQFGCTDTSCCPRNIVDMLENPGRHFLYQRNKQVTELSRVPEQLRPQQFLDQHLRPATDKALAAATINWESAAMATKMQKNRKRLDALRVALGNHAERTPPRSFAMLPNTRAVREAWR